MSIKIGIRNIYTRAAASANPVVALAITTLIVVAILNPAKVGVLLWAVCKLLVLAHAGNWADCRIFGYAQPERLTGIEQGTAWKRKALIVAAAIVAGALAP